MVFTPGKLILAVVDAMVVVSVDDQSVIGSPAVGVNGGMLKYMAFDNG